MNNMEMESPLQQAEALAKALRAVGADQAEFALVLGSGLGGFADRLEDQVAIDYGQIDGMPQSAVPGHAGRLVLGSLGGRRVLVQQGRVHFYEGWSAFEVTRAVRAFGMVGIRGLLLTNAAGGVRHDWDPGTLMRITDHINLQGVSPLFAGEGGQANPYDPRLGAILDSVAASELLPLRTGVYVGNPGPAYETPAEVEMARRLGGDAVGMSTVLEAIAGQAAGMSVCAISCITNFAAGITGEALSHEEVMETGAAVATRFEALLAAAVPQLCGVLEA
ncbi:MAG: purine-nucleoside phosphorylase [Bacteroidia bacterium]|jgi:purine-nucleoside phosphorylase